MIQRPRVGRSQRPASLSSPSVPAHQPTGTSTPHQTTNIPSSSATDKIFTFSRMPITPSPHPPILITIPPMPLTFHVADLTSTGEKQLLAPYTYEQSEP